MSEKRGNPEDETALRKELAQLRTDIDNLVGTVGRLANDVTGAAVDGAKQTVSHAGHQVEDAAEAVLGEGRRALGNAGHLIKSHPYASIAVAAGIGLVLGKLMSRRS